MTYYLVALFSIAVKVYGNDVIFKLDIDVKVI